MSRHPITALTSFCAVWGVAIFGCGDLPSHRQTAQVTGGMESPIAESRENDNERSPTYVNCVGKLTLVEKDHPWFDDGSAGHDDGTAPLASFVLAEPQIYANRFIGILFKYTADADTASSPGKEDIGCQFAFQIPADFLSGHHKTIDNTAVRRFRKVEP